MRSRPVPGSSPSGRYSKWIGPIRNAVTPQPRTGSTGRQGRSRRCRFPHRHGRRSRGRSRGRCAARCRHTSGRGAACRGRAARSLPTPDRRGYRPDLLTREPVQPEPVVAARRRTLPRHRAAHAASSRLGRPRRGTSGSSFRCHLREHPELQNGSIAAISRAYLAARSGCRGRKQTAHRPSSRTGGSPAKIAGSITPPSEASRVHGQPRSPRSCSGRAACSHTRDRDPADG